MLNDIVNGMFVFTFPLFHFRLGLRRNSGMGERLGLSLGRRSRVVYEAILTVKPLGTNPGCNTLGFSAVPGWDPVTGLGKLLQFSFL